MSHIGPLLRKGAVAFAVVGALTFSLSRFTNGMAPIINDISTDLENPPAFIKANIGPLPPAFKAQIKDAYGDLEPVVFDSKDKTTVFDWALEIAQGQPRWTITHEDKEGGAIEGYSTSLLFRFKDDFVIRILELEGSGVVVDMRSRSRVGKSDLGANAARIREFVSLLKAKQGP